MEVKNLLGKLHAHEEEQQSTPPRVPSPPKPRTMVQRPVAQGPAIEDAVHVQQPAIGGRPKMTEDFEGIILDLGEGISLNIPIQRRMSLSDFIKLAEKVKALEMLSENSEIYHKGQF